jgi:hypothetical protein
MMTQEEFMDFIAMKRQGLSIKVVAEEIVEEAGRTGKRSSVAPVLIDER